MEHYLTALNHPPATTSTDLDNCALAASPDLEISEDAPTLSDISRSIWRLKNGKAAGPDGITAELLKAAEGQSAKHLANSSLEFVYWQSSSRVEGGNHSASIQRKGCTY